VKVNPLGLKAFGLALKVFFLVIGEAKITSLCDLALLDEAVLAHSAFAFLL